MVHVHVMRRQGQQIQGTVSAVIISEMLHYYSLCTTSMPSDLYTWELLVPLTKQVTRTGLDILTC
jgi:hypothetical protein